MWIGNDDYTDLKLDGAHAAVPVWAEFMKRAVQLPQYSDVRQFPTPTGVSTVRLDKVTNLIADASCPSDYDAVFLDGTAPTQTCDQLAGDQRNVFQKLFGLGKDTTVAPGTVVNGLPALPGNGGRVTSGSCFHAAGRRTSSGSPAKKEERVFQQVVWRQGR